LFFEGARVGDLLDSARLDEGARLVRRHRRAKELIDGMELIGSE
jgi:hypothetical protein